MFRPWFRLWLTLTLSCFQPLDIVKFLRGLVPEAVSLDTDCFWFGFMRAIIARMGKFDRFASATSDIVASAYFFAACCLLVILWAPTIFLGLSVDTWQLIINTATTIVTFLMVALLQNEQARFERATNQRLELIINAVCGHDPVEDEGQKTTTGEPAE